MNARSALNMVLEVLLSQFLWREESTSRPGSTYQWLVSFPEDPISTRTRNPSPTIYLCVQGFTKVRIRIQWYSCNLLFFRPSLIFDSFPSQLLPHKSTPTKFVPQKKKKKKISLKRVADVTLAELTRGGHRENQSSPPLRSYFSCHRHFPPPGTRDGHVWVRDTWRRRRGGIVCIRRWMQTVQPTLIWGLIKERMVVEIELSKTQRLKTGYYIYIYIIEINFEFLNLGFWVPAF